MRISFIPTPIILLSITAIASLAALSPPDATAVAQSSSATVTRTVVPARARTHTYRFEHDGRSRRYRLHVPPQCAGSLPLVIVLHGAAADYKLIEKVSGMSTLADSKNFLVAYPNGTGIFGNSFTSWNGGDCCGYARKKKVDDVGFIGRLIDNAALHGPVDRSRVYVVGFSNGGMLAYQLAAPLANRIAAMGIIEGSMTGREAKPSLPMPVIMFHGTADKRVPYEGGGGKFAKWGHPVNEKSFEFAQEFWRDANGLPPEKVITRPAPQLIKAEYLSAAGTSGGAVTAYTIIDGPHSWPGGRRSRFWGPKPSPAINASEQIWNFVSSYKREGATQSASR